MGKTPANFVLLTLSDMGFFELSVIGGGGGGGNEGPSS